MNILTSYHPALLSLQSLHEQFPGALEFYLFCQNDGVRAYYSEGKNKSIFLPTEITQTALKPKIQQFRQQKKAVIWGDTDDLPVSKNKNTNRGRQIKQLSIQDEIDQNVLIFRVASLNDDSYDTFAICFSKTFSNFYIPAGRNVLSSELKTSIGKTICNQVTWLYGLHNNQAENIRRIQHAYRQNADALTQMGEELQREQETNRNLLDKYLQQLIREQEINLNCKITLVNGFLDKIKQAVIPIESIKSIVSEAVLTAYDLAIDKSSVLLTPNLIHIQSTYKAQEKRSHKLIELDKTQALLDRYEQAARELEQKSMRINGRNLANQLQISGPAVTDAIKKHSHKIKRLLEKYPSKWELICDFIKPIREMKWEINVSANSG